MAIAEMSKLRMAGLLSERSKILDALASTGLAEIKCAEKLEGTEYIPAGGDEEKIRAILERTENAVSSLSRAIEKSGKDVDKSVLKDGFEVGFSDLLKASEYAEKLSPVMDTVEQKEREISAAQAEIMRLNARKRALLPYAGVEGKLNSYKDTRCAIVQLGILPPEKEGELKALADTVPTFAAELYPSADKTAAVVAVHRDYAQEISSALGSLGFSRCPFEENATAADLIAECDDNIEKENVKAKAASDALAGAGEHLRELKVLADCCYFELEKLKSGEKTPATATAFMLEAYVPKAGQNAVLSAIKATSEYTFIEFAEIDKDEMPPTLMKNGKVVKNFEFVTNMYTPPNYREFDPNAVMALFFSVFLGFIMADVGYGILMMAIGFGYALKTKRDTGMKRLMNVVGYGGIFTAIFGVLFGSFFGFSSVPTEINPYTVPFLPKPLMPDAQSSMLSLAGISIPSVLLIALGMGVVQLMAGNLCKAYAEFREGRVVDGIFFGVIWAVFLGGMLLLVLGLITELNLGFLALPGGIIAGVSLLVAALTAGMHERGFGKVTKGFGAVYGIINYLSDILSYARLYGLMLSGAIIAQIASGQGWQLVVSGNAALAVLGVVVMIIGHAFNLAMGVLGAYIHDARLQYIEFFSRFYGGEGELFSPLGSRHKYVYATLKR